MAPLDPAQAVRRSQLYRWHKSSRAVFATHHDSVLVDHYSDPVKEISCAGRLGICDLSLVPRRGIIGPGGLSWLAENKFEIPQRPNTSLPQANGHLLARLSEQEFLDLELAVLTSSGSDGASSQRARVCGQAFQVPRDDSHCLFSVSGTSAAPLFSMLCAVDLRAHKFPNGSVAQTSVARVNAIVIRQDLWQTNNFLLLAATPAAEYLWDCLLDSAAGLDGKHVGVAALQALSKRKP